MEQHLLQDLSEVDDDEDEEEEPEPEPPVEESLPEGAGVAADVHRWGVRAAESTPATF